MALTVEDGTIVTGADSYVSVADALTYHANMGNSSWAESDSSAQEAALRRATAWIDGMYRSRWKGLAASSTQTLCWPRCNVIDASGWPIDSDDIPQRLKDAVCEAALRSLTTTLAPDLDGGVKREKIGPIETEYFSGQSAPTFTQVAALISDYICSGQELVRG